ncbi:3-phosphoglycerate dehydrogenase family protein [Olsenella sp. YH-ols2217]|uniref:D-3-phosphoglycerate dehydrogenase n=1 Tax=Kribbibacterium absianum TaxID=3044210 RepID=A0ABT6ZHG4_9ACTN|nr:MULTISPECIES: 3-phosphoglycerate dehydrogenase family protein [unclassified Olsenella]MDJ1121000.1 3-phosphoglycerate dehydrogenase family protein [Olsenella sp. YH-ols2216]MDJ1128491.1 3-phosphoglycerate dehydrogenase family protein [Olsenella sp. YH-ols2217]
MPTRSIKIIDDIVKDGLDSIAEGYEIVPDMDGADAVLMRSTDIHGVEVPASVRAIARAGAGTNNIPAKDLAKQGVVVFNTPGANSNAVKELVIGLLMMGSRDVLGGMQWCRQHEDDPDAYKAAEASKKAFVGQEVRGRKIAVIGLGAVGSKVANACIDLGMDVYGYDPYLSVDHAWQLSRDVKRVSDVAELCAGADYLTVHVPRKSDTIGMVSDELLDLLNPGAVVLNYAREDIVDEDAIERAIDKGQVSTFFTDFATRKALHLSHTLVTPHAGAGTVEAEASCARMAIHELVDYLENGNITNSVNFPDCHMGTCRGASRIACLHANVPGMIGQITAVLSNASANVQRMTNENAGEAAYTMFDTDEHLEPRIIDALRDIPQMWRVRVIQ